ELVRAVLEGVVLACYDASRVLAEDGSLPDRLILAGGGARSSLWQQIVSDVFGSSSRRLEVDEQAALGACLLAGQAGGLLAASSAARAWARVAEPVEPDPETHHRYQELFAIFRSAYVAHRGDFAALRAFEET
ncbi:MAG: FGGY-family carbohydrate kinase, partial [Chloroflexota bacterium]|nr:FGGY-family carbohydrate kinase [Chloroflexota bacterium]